MKKVLSLAACAVMSLTVLTGCSGKLDATQTCDYLNEKAAEAGLKEQYKSGADSKELIANFADLLKESASKTSDTKLRDAMNVIADAAVKQNELIDDSSKTLEERGSEIEALASGPEITDAQKYFTETCPDLSGLK